jgi:hypothetical protein
MNERKFEIRCDAGAEGQLQVRSSGLSVAISHSMTKNTTQEMWQSLIVISEQGENGTLTTKVIVCHPNWDQNLQIACIRSAPALEGSDALEIDLKPKKL